MDIGHPSKSYYKQMWDERQWDQCTLSKSVDETKLSGVTDMPEGWDVIQRDLDKLKKWAHGNLKQFNKYKGKLLHQDQSSSRLPGGMEGLKAALLRRTWE
ncbi:hypothetical protein TURU_104935 [Turdus rufiventris]|nr:hypothetical protein TURU_104935 [Turdus rufiventris]